MDVHSALKLCAFSAVADAARTRARAELLPVPEDSLIDATMTADERVCTNNASAELWAIIDRHLRDTWERRLFALLYGQGLKPAEVAVQHADEFPDEWEVYRLTRMAIDRLRRSKELRAEGLLIDAIGDHGPENRPRRRTRRKRRL